jgi:diadenosine tetraphosphate (Ap4A) HIT family hydrolase
MFSLHPTLARDTVVIGHFKLCAVLLMNDQQYPWFILVPQRMNASSEGGYIREIFQLEDADQPQLMRESCDLARALAGSFRCDKLNVAAIGNIVPQLHIHHVVRTQDDPAWPAPIWGKLPAQPYGETLLHNTMTTAIGALTRTVPTFKPAR